MREMREREADRLRDKREGGTKSKDKPVTK